MATTISAAAPAMTAAVTTPHDRAVLRDGSAVLIRPLATGDVKAIITWFEGLGPQARYERFLASIEQLDDRTLSQLAQVDHHEHEALTAVTAEGTTIGLAQYIRLPQTRTAELAVAVADQWQGRGLGSLLLHGIAARARAAGIRWLIVECLASNAAIARVLRRLGPMLITPPAFGVIELRIDLGQASTAAAR